MKQLHLLAQDDQTEVQYDFSGHVMPLPAVLAPHYSNSIKNGTIALV